MERRFRARPTLEAIEARQLPSAMPLVGSGHGAERIVDDSFLTGTLETTRTTVSGDVRLKSLGAYQVAGDEGGISLSNAKGKLVFAATSSPTASQENFAFAYGTGAYGGAKGLGAMRITLRGSGQTSTGGVPGNVIRTTLIPVTIQVAPTSR
jgi:hypothetical protein